ncbi:hypothetical protein MEQU1_003292 [Malassezia equina]|uniref:Uncharacterized protein n=1 Tax=Malassezia equina TaxID=1381935 RepID=A0AAF0EFQ9_9BASI|nr:hypothetical protein MEQU1_003292 [Malassezia equina]
MPPARATPPPTGRLCVPSSEPAIDEARQRARATIDAAPLLSELAGLDDDSDDDMLRTPRRSRRAAAQNTSYRDKLSLTQPADAQAQRQRGMPKPMTHGPSKYSLEALHREKARRARQGLLSHQYADIDALIAQVDAPSVTSDPQAALWTTLETSEAQHLVRLMQLDTQTEKRAFHSTTSFWRAAEPPVMAIDPSEAAVLSCLRWRPWLSPDLVPPIMRLCLAYDERLACSARSTLVARSDCVGRLVAPLLAAMGADPDLLALIPTWLSRCYLFLYV